MHAKPPLNMPLQFVAADARHFDETEHAAFVRGPHFLASPPPAVGHDDDDVACLVAATAFLRGVAVAVVAVEDEQFGHF